MSAAALSSLQPLSNDRVKRGYGQWLKARFRDAGSLSAATVASVVFHVSLLALLAAFFQSGGQESAPLPSYTAVLAPKALKPVTAKQEKIEAGAAPAPSLNKPADVAPAAIASPVPEAALAPALPKLPPAPEYKTRISLERGPVPLADVEPKYPPEAGGVQGTVVLRLLINEQGGVDDVAVASAFPAGLFESAAIEAFKEAKFSPGKQLGVPVKSQMMIEVKFQSFNKGAVAGRFQ